MEVKNLKEAVLFAASNGFEVIQKPFHATGIHCTNFRRKYDGVFILKDKGGQHRACVKSKDSGSLEILFATSLQITQQEDTTLTIRGKAAHGCHTILYLGQAASYYDGTVDDSRYNMLWFGYDGLVFYSTISTKTSFTRHSVEFICDIADNDSIEKLRNFVDSRLGLPKTAAKLMELSVAGETTLGKVLPMYRAVAMMMKNMQK